MKKIKIYDPTLRVFHWLIVALFLGAFIIAKTVDDESPTYVYHMLFGMTLGFTIILRLIWGFLGTEYSKFSSFALSPTKTIEYFKNIFSKEKKYVGHNPASSWAAIAMFTFSFGLIISGLFMVNKINKETIEEVHELLANLFILTVVGHVLGLIIHSIKYKDLLPLSMVTGNKLFNSDENAKPITSKNTQRFIAVIAFIICYSFLFYLHKSYNQTTGQLKVLNYTLQLGEEHDTEDESTSQQLNEKSNSNEKKSKTNNDEDDDE